MENYGQESRFPSVISCLTLSPFTIHVYQLCAHSCHLRLPLGSEKTHLYKDYKHCVFIAIPSKTYDKWEYMVVVALSSHSGAEVAMVVVALSYH